MQVTRADGLKIRTRREAADLTVDEFVALLEERENIKRHPDTIRNIEIRRSQPSFKLLNAIARLLDVPREDLLAEEGMVLRPLKRPRSHRSPRKNAVRQTGSEQVAS